MKNWLGLFCLPFALIWVVVGFSILQIKVLREIIREDYAKRTYYIQSH